MVSVHAGARQVETMEQAAAAMELLAVVYRHYMDRLYEAYPEVHYFDKHRQPGGSTPGSMFLAHIHNLARIFCGCAHWNAKPKCAIELLPLCAQVVTLNVMGGWAQAAAKPSRTSETRRRYKSS